MSKKLRNRMLALVCLGIFAGGGIILYNNWVVQRPFAVILFLVDNFTPSTLTAARIYEGGAAHRLAVEGLPELALLTNYANDYAAPDSAGAVGSIATGRKLNARALGKSADGRINVTLLELARQRGRLTGIVTNLAVTDPAPAAFYAKTQDAFDFAGIAQALTEGNPVDVLLGGGESSFLPGHKEGRRTDGRDLLLEIRQNGYEILRTPEELENSATWRAPKILGVFAPDNLAFVDSLPQANTQPSLSTMVRRAIELLQFNPKGYFLVVDAGLVGRAAANNEGERMLRQFLEFDRALATAQQYAGKDALILVAGKASVGGFRLNASPTRSDRGVAVLGINQQGLPAITWSTGPNGWLPDHPVPAEPAAVHAVTAAGVAEDVLSAGSGPGSGKLHGFLDNTVLFHLIRDQL